MTWASKLFEKRTGVHHMDSNHSRVAYALGHDKMKRDLVSTVLEKEKEIDKERKLINSKIPDVTFRHNLNRFSQARAFRELVEVCSKANEDAQQGIEKCKEVQGE